MNKFYCTAMRPQVDLFSFVFWRKLRTTKRRFEINWPLKFIFSKKATKIDEIFTVDLTLCSKCQIDGEDFINFYGLLRKHEL